MTSPAAFPHSLRRYLLFFFKQKTAYEMRISDWSSDVCSSDLPLRGPGVTLTDVYNAVDYVVPALEIIDARSHQIDPDTKRPRKVFDTIADNAANAGVVLGGRPVRIHDLDLRWVGAILLRNAVIEETGLAAGVRHHTANGVVWLANTLGPRGVPLEPDQVSLRSEERRGGKEGC